MVVLGRTPPPGKPPTARLADGRGYYGYQVYGIADSDWRDPPHGAYLPRQRPSPVEQLSARVEAVLWRLLRAQARERVRRRRDDADLGDAVRLIASAVRPGAR
jgi:hypothetical protein